MTLTERRPVGLDNLMLTILSASLRLVPAETAGLFMRRGNSLVLEAATGVGAEGLTPPFDNTVVGTVAREDRPVLLVADMPTLVPGEQSALVLPLSTGGNWTGVLYLGRAEARSFQPDDVRLLGALNEVAGLAIDSLESLNQRHNQWMLDAESGLYSEAYFSERVREERKRNKRYKRRALLMSLTVQKEQARDQQVSKTLGSLILKHVRETDIAGRLSEESFAVLFLEAPEHEARTITDRIEKAIAHRYKDTIPVSLGLATI